MEEKFPGHTYTLGEVHDITGILFEIEAEKAEAKETAKLSVEEGLEETRVEPLGSTSRKLSLWRRSKARVARVFKK